MRFTVTARPLPPAAVLAAVLATAALLLPPPAAAKTRAECEAGYRPKVGQAGKDVIWVPTPDEVVQHMLDMTGTGPNDLVYDLGAGDGKIAMTAARKYGARAVGIEYNPDMARYAQCLVAAEGLDPKVRIVNGDIFKEDFSRATVVTLYLLPDLNLRLRPTLLAMRPGTRIASHQFSMGDWEPDDTADLLGRSVYLWIVPAPVAGTWAFRVQGGDALAFGIRLEQKYQQVSGDVAFGSAPARQPLVGATLRGDRIRFSFNDPQGVTRSFSGRVEGNEIVGALKAGGRELPARGRR